ncbi:hypothetical protein IMG5_118860 [Ichthyophthirius multifiliis]|uniref:Uncharacterized protein n=1 Tax=Ichthyophthirius multifiliis TaxID=5932 RepID=G0QUR5_ICHMU|nr:hypothetical protein IMG5_118860 [Ichthyophthirius multifiliis]EGR31050.1 hypothetical protein IMG5_118860 [Ichthyophthirius multifiliis]|eukprot:XP_004034536.1 hypothetical protein IMG5_118860 [Ichthyophthirius multifiliis]
MKVMTEQKELVDTETEFFIRDKNNLDDYLYEIESSYLKKEAANNFDQLDMIFIIGDANVRPWSIQMRKILTLLRMCLKVKKYLYTSSWAMQALIFLCASNIEKNIQIVNGGDNGGKLSEIHIMNKDLKNIQPNDYYLDNTTGDLYGFNYETNEWIPKGNCGLHYRRSAQEFQSIGKFIVKAPVYKANTQHKEKYTLYKSRNDECMCVIKKMYMHHWAFQGMDDEFIIPLKNSWDIHTFSFINPHKHFKVLADSDRGPIVIEMENTLGVLFGIYTKYPNTTQSLINFIWNTLRKIKSQQSNIYPSISSYTYQAKEYSILFIYITCIKLINKKAEQKYYKSDVFLHVGFSAKKQKVPQYVYHNSVNSKKLKMKENPNIKIQQYTTDYNPNDQISEPASDIINQSNQNNIIEINNTNINNDEQTGKNMKTENNQNLEFRRQSNKRGSYCRQSRINPDQLFTTGGIRRQLHPNIPYDLIDYSKMWVPGYLSNNHQSKNNSPKKFKIKLKLNYIIQGIKDLQKKQLFVNTPYVSQEEIYIKEQKEKNKKIIGEKDFRVGQTQYNVNNVYKKQSDFNKGTKINFYHNYQFRDCQKDKWLSQTNFKLA